MTAEDILNQIQDVLGDDSLNADDKVGEIADITSGEIRCASLVSRDRRW
jgi:hypothetical protein